MSLQVRLRAALPLATLLLLPEAGLASDFSGISTIVFGIPTLLLANLGAALALGLRPQGAAKAVGVAVLGLVALTSLLLFADALTLLRPPRGGLAFALVYFGLAALLVVQIFVLVTRPPRPEPRPPAPRP